VRLQTQVEGLKRGRGRQGRVEAVEGERRSCTAGTEGREQGKCLTEDSAWRALLVRHTSHPIAHVLFSTYIYSCLPSTSLPRRQSVVSVDLYPTTTILVVSVVVFIVLLVPPFPVLFPPLTPRHAVSSSHPLFPPCPPVALLLSLVALQWKSESCRWTRSTQVVWLGRQSQASPGRH